MTQVELNANQRAVVEAGDEPLLVVAGPGAGKTTVLQARIERLLEQSPRSRYRILGITFTTVAAAAVRQRFVHLPEDQRERVEVGTFHGFAAKILRQHGSLVGLKSDFTIVSAQEDRLAVLRALLKSRGISIAPQVILPLLSKMFENRVDVKDLSEGTLREPLISLLPEIFESYIETCVGSGQIDFPLLVHLCIDLFDRYPDLAEQQRRVYKYICVDEFQDTNNAQFELLQLIIANAREGLVFLADQDQLVYQWNGASPWRLGEAQQRFSMQVLLLPTSFRCPDVILKAANNLISHNSSRFVKPEFVSDSGRSGSLDVVAFNSTDEEYGWLAQQLSSVAPDDRSRTAVIARTRKLLEGAMSICEKEGVPVVSPVARYEFESAPLVMLHNIFRLAVVPGAYTPLDALCGAFYQITGRAVDAGVIRAEALAEESNALELFFAKVRTYAKSDEFRNMDASLSNDLIAKGRFRVFSKAFFAWAEKVVEIVEARAKVAYRASYDLEKVLWLEFETANRNLKFRDFVQTLDLESKTPKYKDWIPFLTAHGAKGLEFSRVYIIDAAENQFPAYQAVKQGDGSDPMEEERRSFFVAITRCSEDLVISYAASYGGFRAEPSRFITEMAM